MWHHNDSAVKPLNAQFFSVCLDPTLRNFPCHPFAGRSPDCMETVFLMMFGTQTTLSSIHQGSVVGIPEPKPQMDAKIGELPRLAPPSRRLREEKWWESVFFLMNITRICLTIPPRCLGWQCFTFTPLFPQKICKNAILDKSTQMAP